MNVIDVHNHLYPKEWMAFLEGRPGSPTMVTTGPGESAFYYGDMRLATVSEPGHYDPAARVADMDAYGISTQIISMSTPSVELIPAREGIAWAKRINDYLASVCETYGDRLFAYATLPYQDVDAAVAEAERAHTELGVKGIAMFSNICGEPIYDPRFWPVYEVAQAYEMPVFIHPGPPITTEALRKVGMPLPLYGFIMDTSMAVTGLIFNGVLDRYPGLRLIHAHLGGVFPYLAGRIDDCYKTYKKDFGFATLDALPSEVYPRSVYVDAISFNSPAMRCALDYLGAEHIMIGTDYAHPIGGWDRVMSYVEDLGLSNEDLERVCFGNATELFKLS